LRLFFVPEILKWNQQHAEAFSVLGTQVLVMHLVRPAYGPQVPVVAVAHEFEALVNENIMHQEVTATIQRDTDTHEKFNVVSVDDTKEHEQETGNGEDQEEGVVPFKKSLVALVVVAVKYPKQSVHNVFVGDPCHSLHHDESDQNGQNFNKDFHDQDKDNDSVSVPF
jgi:hypothetical protein